MPDDLTTRAEKIISQDAAQSGRFSYHDTSAAVVKLVLDEAAQYCENMRGLGYADVSLTGPMPVGKVIGRAIRALGVQS